LQIQYCSFCGKADYECGDLVMNKTETAFICFDCADDAVWLITEIKIEEKKEEQHA
jgi:hypothetical protein